MVSIRETSRFLIEIMPLMFVPAGVGLLSSWGVLKPVCVPIMVIVLISTIIVMAVSGKVTQGVIRMEKKPPKEKTVQTIFMLRIPKAKGSISVKILSR